MHLQIKMDQKSFSLRRLVLKEKCSSFSSILKLLMVECGRVKTSPTALVYTHTTTQARINRRKVFVEPMLAVQRVKYIFHRNNQLYTHPNRLSNDLATSDVRAGVALLEYKLCLV
ncbi:Hypothetical_protein [Hexamita inflata]|uniref:Hypothetical_protein n=1 Tax=Hexamita inflata TaxID=28002 RepID=A0AA86Q996_9EUKA|nr:Hypothetical protein HINF_LOCUS36187 [Hexamita inflata]